MLTSFDAQELARTWLSNAIAPRFIPATVIPATVIPATVIPATVIPATVIPTIRSSPHGNPR